MFFSRTSVFTVGIYGFTISLGAYRKTEGFSSILSSGVALDNGKTRAKLLPVKHHKPAAIGSAQAHNMFYVKNKQREKKLVFRMTLECVSLKFPPWIMYTKR